MNRHIEAVSKWFDKAVVLAKADDERRKKREEERKAEENKEAAESEPEPEVRL